MPPRILICATALVLLAACIPAEPDDDVMRTFDPIETVMGEIQQRGVLRVGIEPDLLPLSKATGHCIVDNVDTACSAEGFAVDLAQEVADSLGVDVQFVTGGTTELLGMPEAGRADVAFPFIPITEERVRNFAFTDPYFVAHERLLVTAESDVEQVGDIASERVCQALDPDTGVPINELIQFVTPVTGGVSDCRQMFLSGQVDVVVGPDLALSGIAQGGDAKIVGDQLNTEGYSAVLETGAAAWVDYVDQVLEEAQQEGRWTEYFHKWIEPGLGGSLDPPGMSLEEAAALYPISSG
jgi:polar amino acid transport system substrate-binding protein